nr:atherin-like [Aegilops tauschii subsp. strangulata]
MTLAERRHRARRPPRTRSPRCSPAPTAATRPPPTRAVAALVAPLPCLAPAYCRTRAPEPRLAPVAAKRGHRRLAPLLATRIRACHCRGHTAPAPSAPLLPSAPWPYRPTRPQPPLAHGAAPPVLSRAQPSVGAALHRRRPLLPPGCALRRLAHAPAPPGRGPG